MSGYSSAWLERLLWEQKVARSNRVTPTIFKYISTSELSPVLFSFSQTPLNPKVLQVAPTPIPANRESQKPLREANRPILPPKFSVSISR